MKKLILVILFLLSLIASGQDIRNTISIKSDPVATYKDGFNIGLEFDYQREYSFNRVALFHFPNLRGQDYTELTGLHGVNVHFDKYTHRVSLGLKTGFIWRKVTGSTPHPIIGFVGSYEYYFNNNFFVGLQAGYDYRGDNKIWSANLDPFWRYNGWIKIGFVL